MIKYRPEIDGLRAIAVLPVILFHAGFEWFSGGFVGVDVFFVISGYLITTIIISEMAEEKFSIVNFYERRARRILPALFFLMIATIPLSLFWFSFAHLKDFGQSLIAVSFFSSNILFFLESGYFDVSSEAKPLLHTWSLAVEEQYYIIFPILLAITWRLGINKILILLFFLLLISLGAAQWSAYNSPASGFYLLHTRAWELLVGVFIAFYLRYNSYLKSGLMNQALSLTGLSMVVYSIYFFDEYTPFPSFYTLIPVLGTGLLILCSVPRTFLYKILSLSPMVGIGLISYSAYLWHQPILVFSRNRLMNEISDLLLIGLCIFSFLMAWVSWKFIESPFRDKNKFSRKFIFTSSLILITIFCMSGFWIIKNAKLPSSFVFSDNEIELIPQFKGLIHEGKNCTSPKLRHPNDFCEIREGNIGHEIILIGDSHARVLSEAFKSRIVSKKSFIDLTRDGCPFLLNTDIIMARDIGCSKSYQEARNNVLLERPKSIVVYQSNLPDFLTGKTFDNEKGIRKKREPVAKILEPPSKDDNLSQHLLSNLKHTLETIAQNTERLYVILPAFDNGWNPIFKLSELKASGLSLREAKDYLKIPRELVERRRSLINNTIRATALQHDNIHIIDPIDIFCSKEFCSPINIENELLFSDKDHYSLIVNEEILSRISLSLN